MRLGALLTRSDRCPESARERDRAEDDHALHRVVAHKEQGCSPRHCCLCAGSSGELVLSTARCGRVARQCSVRTEVHLTAVKSASPCCPHAGSLKTRNGLKSWQYLPTLSTHNQQSQTNHADLRAFHDVRRTASVIFCIVRRLPTFPHPTCLRKSRAIFLSRSFALP